MQQSSAEIEDFENSSQGGLNFKPLLKTARRHALLITGITAVFGVGAYLKTMASPPTYKAEFQLLVEPVAAEAQLTDPSNIARDDRTIRNPNEMIDYDTQLEILQSPRILNEIVEQVNVQYPEFNAVMLKQGLEIQRQDNTKIIEISYLDSDPARAQQVAYEISQKYLNYSLDERKTRIGEGIRFIEQQLPELQARVSSLQEDLQALQQNYSIIDPEEEGGQLAQRLQEISSLQEETNRQLQEQRVLYENLQSQLALNPNEAIAATALSEDPTYQAIQSELQLVDSKIALESVRFSDASPPVQALLEERNNLETLLEQQTQRVIGPGMASAAGNPQVRAYQNSIRQNLTQQMVDTINLIGALEARSQGISQERGTLEQQLQQYPGVVRQYNDLQRRLELATRTLDQFLAQRETLRVEAAQNEVPWERVSEPAVPEDENGNAVPEERDPKLLVLGIAAGLLTGTLLALLIDKLLDIFHSVDDVQDVTDVPILGVIPYCSAVARSRQPGWITPQELGNYDRANVAQFVESFSELYASIRYLDDPPVHSVAVCSASPDDGKSTVALNLARTVAGTGQRVLIVDANFRRPNLYNLLGIPNAKGLSELLTNEDIEPMEVIQRSPDSDNLFVLTAGNITANSPKMLASTRMERLSKQLGSAFDFVIYDTPHLLGIMDAIFLSAYTDGVLMAISQRQTKRSAVKQVMAELAKYSIPVLGITFNRVRQKRSKIDQYSEPLPVTAPAKSEPPASRVGARLITPSSASEINAEEASLAERLRRDD